MSHPDIAYLVDWALKLSIYLERKGRIASALQSDLYLLNTVQPLQVNLFCFIISKLGIAQSVWIAVFMVKVTERDRKLK